jgi:hypothetical protein
MKYLSPLATLTLLVALLALTACEELAAPELDTAPALANSATAGGSAESDEVGLDEWITRRVTRYDLYLGTSAELRGERRVSFDAVGLDSRCPIGLDCVRAGEIAAHFTVTTPHGSVPVELTIPGGDPKALPLHEAPWASVDGLILYLVQLSPYPVADGDGEPTAESLGGAAGLAPRPPEAVVGDDYEGPDLDTGPLATLIVRPCPNTGERCAGGSDPAPPVLTTIRSAGGGLANLTFRTDEGVPLGDEPLLLTIGDEAFELPLQAGPARFTDPDGTVVDQASYAMSRTTLHALAGAPHDGVTVSVALAGVYVAFPYVSGDLIESGGLIESGDLIE